jgi:hypothetical protein
MPRWLRARREGVSASVPRQDADASGGDAVTGYLYVSAEDAWQLYRVLRELLTLVGEAEPAACGLA